MKETMKGLGKRKTNSSAQPRLTGVAQKKTLLAALRAGRQFIPIMVKIMSIMVIMVVFGCSKPCPNQSRPVPPGHTPLALMPRQVSTRRLTLAWKNDSAAVSRAYLLVRSGPKGVDTIYNVAANAHDTIVVKDSLLTPSTTYNYMLYRLYRNAHWDSAQARVPTLDTTKDNYQWTVTKLGTSGSVLYAVWGKSPNSVWLAGGVDSGDVIHYVNGSFHYYNAGVFQTYSVYGTSDSNVWFGDNGGVVDWNGSKFTIHDFTGDSLPRVTQDFTGIWIAPDIEIFVACSGGAIVHRSADGKWETQSTPTTLALASIIGFAKNDIYASGAYSNYQGILLHYDGTSWSEDSAAKAENIYKTIGAIYSIYGESADSLYIVGSGIMHHKGNAWEKRTPPQLFGYAYGVHSQGFNDVFVCGDQGMLLKFDGDHWISYYTIPQGFGESLLKVITLNNEVFAVGADDNTAYFVHGQ
jgi:hypothetical protein